jgi:hypothetical protein
LVVGVAVGFAGVLVAATPIGILLGMTAGEALFVVLGWWVLWPLDADDTQANVTREDFRPAAEELLVVFTSVAGLVGIVVLLLVGRSSGRELAATVSLAGVFLAGIGFVTVMSFSVSVVMGQEYLPSRLGIASGITLGFSIGVGGIFAALFGLVADRAGLETVMWIVAALPLVGLALALTLPLTAQEARLNLRGRAATARTGR